MPQLEKRVDFQLYLPVWGFIVNKGEFIPLFCISIQLFIEMMDDIFGISLKFQIWHCSSLFCFCSLAHINV